MNDDVCDFETIHKREKPKRKERKENEINKQHYQWGDVAMIM